MRFLGDIQSVVILSRADDEESLDIQNQRSTREVPRFARNDEGHWLTRPHSPRAFAFRATSRARILSRRKMALRSDQRELCAAPGNDAAPAPAGRSFQTHSFGFAHPLRHAKRSAFARSLHQTSRFAGRIDGARMRTQSRREKFVVALGVLPRIFCGDTAHLYRTMGLRFAWRFPTAPRDWRG